MVDQTVLDQYDPELQARILQGEVVMHPGQDPAKPVLRDSVTGQLVKGSGLTPQHNDLGRIAKSTAYKRTNAYRDAFETLMPADLDPNRRGSIAWLLERAMDAAEGGWVNITAQCPACDHRFETKAWKRPDANAITKVLEHMLGRAKETQEVNINEHRLYELIDQRVSTEEIEVHARDPRSAAETQARVERARQVRLSGHSDDEADVE